MSLTPWMDLIAKHEGEKEVAGRKDNPFIMSLYPFGNYPKEHDEVPWCACLANWALISSGYIGTKSAAAKSFARDKFGTVAKPQFGAIIVIRHTSGHYHVTFFDHWVDEAAKVAVCFGGNQSNTLRKSTYNLNGNKNGHDEIVACRWPIAKKVA